MFAAGVLIDSESQMIASTAGVLADSELQEDVICLWQVF